jgi:hypothetical protein
MQSAPEPALTADSPTATKLVMLGVVIGFVLAQVLRPPEPVRVVRFRVVDAPEVD